MDYLGPLGERGLEGSLATPSAKTPQSTPSPNPLPCSLQLPSKDYPECFGYRSEIPPDGRAAAVLEIQRYFPQHDVFYPGGSPSPG